MNICPQNPYQFFHELKRLFSYFDRSTLNLRYSPKLIFATVDSSTKDEYENSLCGKPVEENLEGLCVLQFYLLSYFEKEPSDVFLPCTKMIELN